MRLTAFLILALATSAGFWRMGQVNDDNTRIRSELYRTRVQADRNLCEKINKSTAVLLELIERSASNVEPPDGISPELREAYRQAAERGASFRAFAAELLQPEDCSVPPIGSRRVEQ